MKEFGSMLVSAIASFRAIAMQNNAAMNMMRINQNNQSMMRAAGSGDMSFNALHQQDVRNEVGMAQNSLKYAMASAWKKQAEKMLKDEIKQNRLNVIA